MTGLRPRPRRQSRPASACDLTRAGSPDSPPAPKAPARLYGPAFVTPHATDHHHPRQAVVTSAPDRQLLSVTEIGRDYRYWVTLTSPARNQPKAPATPARFPQSPDIRR